MNRQEHKFCRGCQETKPRSEFRLDKRTGRLKSALCKSCDVRRLHEWDSAHPKAKHERNARWKLAHPTYQAEWMGTHPGYSRGPGAAWRLTHPDRVRAYKTVRRAKVRGNGGAFTADQWEDLLDRCDHRCLCCGKNDVRLAADHVLPVSKGGTSDISNIQPLCKSCNSHKGARHIDYRPEWT